ncbi:hypothetical protein FO519_000970 [Halicephalobus sp. NKZ332]|nr:hypothetical protein FO519_000970 [Halicephalobus sp. NKZ332]
MSNVCLVSSSRDLTSNNSLNYPLSEVLIQPIPVYRDFAVFNEGARIFNSSGTWRDAPSIRYFYGVPIMYDVRYSAKTLLRKDRRTKKEICWLMSGNRGFFEMDLNDPIDISFVRYEHYEINNAKDRVNTPTEFRVFGYNSTIVDNYIFLTEFTFSSGDKEAVPIIPVPYKISRVKVEVSGNRDGTSFTSLCKFYVYGSL